VSVALIFHKKTARKTLMSAVLLILVGCVLLNSALCVLISQNPVIICPDEYRIYIDGSRRAAISSEVRGLYKNAGLLFPAVIEVDRASYTTLELHITYMFYGTVDYSIDDDGVKSIDKPLF
jgi:hypothetical protein